mmetsp:Transcript_64584/g.172733  ORF Transcript_64584/g.172733 Transcript_64584/m.172733 type:complete len:118 (-) Transcript_64584:80-433(-)
MDTRQAALMLRLNESASWLSDVSRCSTSSAGTEASEGEKAKLELQMQMQPWLAARHLCMAEALNESVTWLEDVDVEDSDPEEEGSDADTRLAAGGVPGGVACAAAEAGAGLHRPHSF